MRIVTVLQGPQEEASFCGIFLSVSEGVRRGGLLWPISVMKGGAREEQRHRQVV